MKKQKKYFHGFTLVELIIVISILAILAIIAFVSFQSYTKDAKDSKRIASIKNIDTGISLLQVKTGLYPDPDEFVPIFNEDSDVILLKQGIIGNNITALINLNKKIDSSQNNELYLYSTTGDNKKYQLGVYLEDSSSLSLIPHTYAQYNYANKFFYTIGNKIGILLEAGTKKPISKSNYSTGLKLSEANSDFIVYFSHESASGSIIGTGAIIGEKIQESQNTLTIKCNNDVPLTGNKVYFNSQDRYSFSTTVSVPNTITYNSSAHKNTCEWKCAEGFYEDNGSCLASETNPSGLVLTHTPGNKTFSFSLNAGIGNGGSCKLQFYKNNSSRVNISETIYNCDSTISSTSVSLPSDGWNGNWTSLEVRLIRTSDNKILGTFDEKLTCSIVGSSGSATPNIDEDCDGNWDDIGGDTWTLSGTGTNQFYGYSGSNGALGGCGLTVAQCKSWGASSNRKYISAVHQSGYGAFCCYGNSNGVKDSHTFISAEHYILQSGYN